MPSYELTWNSWRHDLCRLWLDARWPEQAGHCLAFVALTLPAAAVWLLRTPVYSMWSLLMHMAWPLLGQAGVLASLAYRIPYRSSMFWPSAIMIAVAVTTAQTQMATQEHSTAYPFTDVTVHLRTPDTTIELPSRGSPLSSGSKRQPLDLFLPASELQGHLPSTCWHQRLRNSSQEQGAWPAGFTLGTHKLSIHEVNLTAEAFSVQLDVELVCNWPEYGAGYILAGTVAYEQQFEQPGCHQRGLRAMVSIADPERLHVYSIPLQARR